jgi:integrase
MRSLLVEHDALASRDERLARFQSWAVLAQQRITTDEHRKVIARFIRWNLEKRLRSMRPVTDSAFLRAKQTVTVTIEFCNWLAVEHDATVEQLTQAHIDLWQSTGPTTREHIIRFIRWAIKARLISFDLDVTPHRRGTAPRMPVTQQNAVIEKVAHQQTLHPRDRLAAILVMVFAQRAEDIAALTWNQVTITADAVSIDLAGMPIDLPPPLDEPVRTLAASNYNNQTAAHPNSPWVFRGYRPGMHVTHPPTTDSLRPRGPVGHPQRTHPNHPDRHPGRNAGLQPADARSPRSRVGINLFALYRYPTRLTESPYRPDSTVLPCQLNAASQQLLLSSRASNTGTSTLSEMSRFTSPTLDRPTGRQS